MFLNMRAVLIRCGAALLVLGLAIMAAPPPPATASRVSRPTELLPSSRSTLLVAAKTPAKKPTAKATKAKQPLNNGKPKKKGPAFSACGSRFECATIQVPRDYRNADERTIGVYVSRRKARVPSQRIGVLFLNPGGPGGPTLDLVRSAESFLEPEVLDRFDIIGVDPRGTERSTPIVCSANLPPEPAIESTAQTDQEAEIEETRQSFSRLAKRCAASEAQFLLSMDTETAARDLDAVREWLGEPSISYLGMSYGTYLGSVYMALFPNRVRVAVLDSAINPDRFGEPMVLDRVTATDAALDGFLAACASGALAPCKFNNGTDLAVRYSNMRNRFIASANPQAGNTPQSLAAFLDQTVASLVGFPLNGWPILGRALDELDRTGKAEFGRQPGDARVDLPGSDIVPFDTFSNIVNIAVNCRDGILPRGAESYESIRSKIPTLSARFAGLIDDSLASLACVEWPAPVVGQVPLRFAPAATLVIANRFDLTTPLVWSQSLATKIGAPLLLREGGGHVGIDKSPCVSRYVTAFLRDGTPPPPQATCTGVN